MTDPIIPAAEMEPTEVELAAVQAFDFTTDYGAEYASMSGVLTSCMEEIARSLARGDLEMVAHCIRVARANRAVFVKQRDARAERHRSARSVTP